VPGISAVHELHIWKLSGNKIIATAHVRCHNSEEYMQIATKLKSFFHKRGIHSTTIQPEFTDLGQDVPSDDCILVCEKVCDPHTCCGQSSANLPALKPNKESFLNTDANANNNNNNNKNNKSNAITLKIEESSPSPLTNDSNESSSKIDSTPVVTIKIDE
jgi:hypothetical protein